MVLYLKQIIHGMNSVDKMVLYLKQISQGMNSVDNLNKYNDYGVVKSNITVLPLNNKSTE